MSEHSLDEYGPLLTVSDTARVLRVTRITVRRWIAKGHLESVKIGQWQRVRKASIAALIGTEEAV